MIFFISGSNIKTVSMCLRVPIAVMNTMTKKQVEEERVAWLTPPHCCSSQKEVSTGIPKGQDPGGRS